jgi:para-nitrobenzyl esterase
MYAQMAPGGWGRPQSAQGVVLVAMNYRVGRFGFFAFPALSTERPDESKGNYAYMDQLAALQAMSEATLWQACRFLE